MPVLIVAGSRSPFARVDGALARWHPVDLAAHVMAAACAQASLEPAEIDEVWVGCAEPVGAQGANMARAAILTAGWPDRVHGSVIDSAETSATAALHAAVAALESGIATTAVVAGVSSASIVQPGAGALGRTYGRPWGEGPSARVADAGGLLPAPHMADSAALAAGVGRIAQDGWAERSHVRRIADGPTSIEPIAAQAGDRVAVQNGTPVDADELRTRPADPAGLSPSFDPEGAVTGFSFAPAADGAAAIVLRAGLPEADSASQRHIPRIIGTGRAGGDPRDPLGGVEIAVSRALHTAKATLAEVARWEIAEPTAAAALLAIDRLGLEPERVNPAGGMLAVGDAGGAEELRLLVDALRADQRPGLLAQVAFGPSGSAATIVQRS